MATSARRLASIATGLALALVGLTTTAAGASAAPAEDRSAAAITYAPDGELDLASDPLLRRAPKGRRGQWAYGYANRGRWNPCKPIRWAYNPRGGYKKSFRDTRRAMKRVQKRTGLPLVFAGGTKSRVKPFGDLPAGVDIVIRWAGPGSVPELQGRTLGFGGGKVGTWTNNPTWEAHSGFVVLNRKQKGQIRRGFARSGRPTWGQVITHEILHVLGLNHTNAPSQLMYPIAHAGNHRFGKGDLRGMKMIGASQGCNDQGMR